MQRISLSIAGIALLALMTSCASHTEPATGSSPAEPNVPAVSEELDVDAQQQAQAWLDTAAIPPGAVRTTESPGSLASYTWPCKPFAKMESYWVLDGGTVASTINWLKENPTPGLVNTVQGEPMQENPTIDSAMLGHIPVDDSQQGIVYEVMRQESGVAIRVEVAALAESATCPSLPPGYKMGRPGEG